MDDVGNLNVKVNCEKFVSEVIRGFFNKCEPLWKFAKDAFTVAGY